MLCLLITDVALLAGIATSAVLHAPPASHLARYPETQSILP